MIVGGGMKASTRAEIERIIGNRHTEQHPFQTRRAGMEWFARMLPLVQQLTKKETEEFLAPLLDNLLPHTNCCLLCKIKLLVFAEIYCSQKSARKAIGYWKQYQQCIAALYRHVKLSKGEVRRDFRTDVYHAIEQFHEEGDRG